MMLADTVGSARVKTVEELPVKPSICIVAHKAYGAFCGGRAGHIGGVEWQTSLLARWLAGKNYNVSLLTWDEGGPQVEMLDGVRVVKIARAKAGLKGLRFWHPRWTGLIRAMKLANADVYYQNGAESTTGQVAMWCRQNNRAFVFSVASNLDCVESPVFMTTRMEPILFRYGIRRADTIITQTETQREELRKIFGLQATVIPMPSPGPATWTPDERRRQRGILWVGRISPVKRPELFLDLAEACPDLNFEIVGPPYPDEYTQNILKRAAQISNMTYHGAATRERMPDYYRNAACLCCTSEAEGFPNTFLEAWSHGLPIVSTFDPDRLIERQQLGAVANDQPGLATVIRSLVSSAPGYLAASERARRYFVENHALETVMPKFEAALAMSVKN